MILPVHRPALVMLVLLGLTLYSASQAQKTGNPNQLAWSLKYDPKTLDPPKVDDQASEMVRYLTGGVLLRVNRKTQQVEPALATSWSISPDGLLAIFHLRNGLHFSDGSPLTSGDVASTLNRILNAATSAPVAQEFIVPTKVTVDTPDPLTVKVNLPRRVVSIGKIFDEIAIEPANRVTESRVTAGPFVVDQYKRGEFLSLRRNPYYWKHDTALVQLPYLRSLRLDILSNREQDQLRFRRGQYAFIDTLPPENYGVLALTNAQSLHDLGPSLNTEQLWFNQAADAPLPPWEKQWFQSRGFRLAVSQAIHRSDLARIAYAGHATPATGFISPANTVWRNTRLEIVQEDSKAAQARLAKDGFRRKGDILVDRQGHPVIFSILTNSGNRSREKMAVLIQQDLALLGMQVNVVTLDFPALIERLMHTQAYEAALLGLSNVEPDPSSMMNLWLSSSPNHQWSPSEKSPATDWEAEIDQQMQMQASTLDGKERKRAFDRVQQIVADQQPFIYLVYPNVLYAVSPLLTGVELTVLQPGVVSNIESIRWKEESH